MKNCRKVSCTFQDRGRSQIFIKAGLKTIYKWKKNQLKTSNRRRYDRVNLNI